MSSFTSVFLSILVHAALIFAAFYFTQSFWFDEPEKKPEIAEYTMDLVPEEENKVVPLKKEQPKAQPKKVIKKKPVVARKPNPKLKAPIIIKKIRPAAEEKNLYTQKQKSPVSIEPSKQQVAGAPAAGSTVEAQDAATTLGVEDTASNPTVLSNNSNAEPTQQQVTGTPLEGPEEEAPEAATTLGVENSPTILANPNGVRDGRLLVQAPGNLPPKYPTPTLSKLFRNTNSKKVRKLGLKCPMSLL